MPAPFPVKALFAFVVVVAAVFATMLIADAALASAATENTTVVNETITQDVGNWTPVAASGSTFEQGFEPNATVYNSSDVRLTNGTDYRWSPTNGSVLFFSTANTTDGADANVTYSYQQNVEAVRNGWGPIAATVAALSRLAVVPFILFILGLFVWMIVRIRSAMSRSSTLAGGGR